MEIQTLCNKRCLEIRALNRFVHSWEFTAGYVQASEDTQSKIIEAINKLDYTTVKELTCQNLLDKTYRELRKLARRYRIKYYSSLSKAELVNALANVTTLETSQLAHK